MQGNPLQNILAGKVWLIRKNFNRGNTKDLFSDREEINIGLNYFMGENTKTVYKLVSNTLQNVESITVNTACFVDIL